MSKVIVPNLKFDSNEFELEGEIVDNIKQKCLDGSIFEYYLVKTKYGINKYIKEEVKPKPKKMSKVTHMTTEEINLERNELEPMVLIMKETNIVEHDGINYFDIAKRYHELCKESVVRELLNQNKDE